MDTSPAPGSRDAQTEPVTGVQHTSCCIVGGGPAGLPDGRYEAVTEPL
ncbi:MAG TPA: hypothetical protein VF142_20995 [Longimicrobium sp.]